MAERWRRGRKRFWAGVLGAVLLAAWGAAAAPVPGLGYTTTSAEAGAPARYGFLLPGEASKLWAPGEPWTLVFDGALDVAAYRRRLRLCYARHSSGLRPAHSRCVGPIPATIEVSTASGEDRVTITPTRAWEANRPLGVWVDLINPMDPGTYEVQLLQVDQPLASWHLRVEQPGVDSPGAP
jgi:hypothetical protein